MSEPARKFVMFFHLLGRNFDQISAIDRRSLPAFALKESFNDLSRLYQFMEQFFVNVVWYTIKGER